MGLNWFKKKKAKTDSTDVQTEVENAFDPPSPEATDTLLPDTDTSDSTAALDDMPVSGEEMSLSSAPPAEKRSGGLFARLKSGLSKTRKILTTDIDDLFLGKKLVDDDMLEELEELLITADMGVQTTMEIMEKISKKRSRIAGAKELKTVLKEEILSYFEALPAPEPKAATKPHVVMVVGGQRRRQNNHHRQTGRS